MTRNEDRASGATCGQPLPSFFTTQKQHEASASHRATLAAQQSKIATLQGQAAMIARLAARLAEIESGAAPSRH